MNKILKLTAQIIGVLVLLYIIIMLLLFAFVKTKDFTPIVSKLFYQQTGQRVQIDGKIKLSIFPWPAVKASNITIYNPKQFPAPASIKYLAKIGEIKARLKIVALFHGNVQLANIFLDHVDLNLITSRSGKTNWNNLINYRRKLAQPKKGTSQQPLTTDKTDPIKQPPKMISADEFPVIQVDNSVIHFINLQTNSRTDLTDFSLTSPGSQDPFIRRIALSAKVQHDDPKTRVELKLSAKVHFDPKRTTMTLKDLLLFAKWFQVQHILPKPIALIMRGTATLHGEDFKTNLHGHFGESEGQILLNAQRDNELINAKVAMKNVYLNSLMIILTGKNWITGMINASTNLTTRGKTFENWLSNLSGSGQFAVTDGKIKGLNIDLMVSNTLNQLLSQNKQINVTTDEFTAFKTISANFNINRGQLTSNNFLLDANTVKATGKGNINLPNATINAGLTAIYVKNPNWQIPLIVKGSLFKPVIQPDTAAIAKQLLQQNINKNIGNALKQLFD